MRKWWRCCCVAAPTRRDGMPRGAALLPTPAPLGTETWPTGSIPWWTRRRPSGRAQAAVVHGSGRWTQLPQPRLGSSNADIVRASELQHAVERMDGDVHLG